MRYLHTMLRARNLDQALDFYCNKLGLKEARRRVDEKHRPHDRQTRGRRFACLPVAIVGQPLVQPRIQPPNRD